MGDYRLPPYLVADLARGANGPEVMILLLRWMDRLLLETDFNLDKLDTKLQTDLPIWTNSNSPTPSINQALPHQGFVKNGSSSRVPPTLPPSEKRSPAKTDLAGRCGLWCLARGVGGVLLRSISGPAGNRTGGPLRALDSASGTGSPADVPLANEHILLINRYKYDLSIIL